MSTQALILIDLQNEYLPSGKLPLCGIEAAAANAARLLADARSRNIPVIHIRHEALDPARGMFVPGSDGVQTQPAVAAQPGEPVVVKNHTNSFRDTGLHELLQQLGIQQLVIAGAMSQNCIDTAVRAAFDMGYRITLIHDACATRDLSFNGITVLAAQVQATIMAALGFQCATLLSTEQYLGG